MYSLDPSGALEYLALYASTTPQSLSQATLQNPLVLENNDYDTVCGTLQKFKKTQPADNQASPMIPVDADRISSNRRSNIELVELGAPEENDEQQTSSCSCCTLS